MFACAQVDSPDEVTSSYRQVQGEIPGSPIFIMKMASNARHLEVQLLADKHGEVIILSFNTLNLYIFHFFLNH